MSDGDSLYELLGLEGLDATDKDIKRAFRWEDFNAVQWIVTH